MANKLLVAPGTVLITATRGGDLLVAPFMKDGQPASDLYPHVTCYGMGQTGKLYLNDLADYTRCSDDDNPLVLMKRATHGDAKMYWTIDGLVKAMANLVVTTTQNPIYPTGASVKSLNANGFENELDEATMTILLGTDYRITVNGQVSCHEEYTDPYSNGSTLAFYFRMADYSNREQSRKWEKYSVRSAADIISVMNRIKEAITDPHEVIKQLGGLVLRLR